jgi:hypothetical protein
LRSLPPEHDNPSVVAQIDIKGRLTKEASPYVAQGYPPPVKVLCTARWRDFSPGLHSIFNNLRARKDRNRVIAGGLSAAFSSGFPRDLHGLSTGKPTGGVMLVDSRTGR